VFDPARQEPTRREVRKGTGSPLSRRLLTAFVVSVPASASFDQERPGEADYSKSEESPSPVFTGLDGLRALLVSKCLVFLILDCRDLSVIKVFGPRVPWTDARPRPGRGGTLRVKSGETNGGM